MSEQGLEGVVGKRKDGPYEPGKRTGSWVKMRINKGQEFVSGGFIPGPHGVDSIIVGYYRGRICTTLPEWEMDLCQQPAEWFTRS